MEKRQYLTGKQKKLCIIIGTVIAVYFGMKYLLPLVVPFLFAYFIAWLLRPVVAFFHRALRIPVVIGGSVGVLVLLSSIVLLIFYLGRAIMTQFILLLRNVPVYAEFISGKIDHLCVFLERMLRLQSGSIHAVVDDTINSLIAYVQSDLLPRFTEQTIRMVIALAGLLGIMIIILIAAVLIIKDMEEYKAGLRKSEFYPAVHRITQKLSDTGVAYMKTQAVIMTIIASIISIAFFILGNPYALLIGIFVGIFDAFPVLGSGLILVPWSVMMLIEKNFFAAAVIMTTYGICQVVREVLEPRLLGNKIGIKPIYNMVAMYIGVELFGVIGFFLGPLAAVIIKTVVKTYGSDTQIITCEDSMEKRT